jgi:cardiolipin synthase
MVRRAFVRLALHPRIQRPPAGIRAMLVLRDNLANRRAIERAYLKALGGARR